MSATSKRDALINQLKNDANLIAVIPAAQIKKGVEPNFNVETNPKGIRVAIIMSQSKILDLPSTKVDARYGYGVLYYFYETDPEKADDRATEADELIREAIEKIPDLGAGVGNVVIGTTQFRDNKKIPNLHFCFFPVVCEARELRGNR